MIRSLQKSKYVFSTLTLFQIPEYQSEEEIAKIEEELDQMENERARYIEMAKMNSGNKTGALCSYYMRRVGNSYVNCFKKLKKKIIKGYGGKTRIDSIGTPI